MYVAKPTSRQKIREVTQYLREMVGLKDEMYFPIVEFLEFGLHKISPDFSLEIRSVKEMRNEYGITYPKKDVICLREDVYENAINGIGRDRFTVAHEIGHYFMHDPGSLSFNRSQTAVSIPSYKDPEWQANTFAGELLAPPRLIRGMSVKEVALSCGVSQAVAGIQLKNI